MSHVCRLTTVLVFQMAFVGVPAAGAEDPSGRSGEVDVPEIRPAKSTNSGLLLEPPLDLDWYTREKFVEQSTSVGVEKILKEWTSPVVPLEAPKRSDAHGLSEDEVKEYMQEAKRRFDSGGAIPVSDVGLISTQEDVVREPMLNHISVFENAAARVYLLVQKLASGGDWGYFSIVQDMTLDTPRDYYAQILESDVRFEGTSCYKCHSSGPLAIHPARADLVLDAKLAAALNAYIREQPRSEFHFPPDSPMPPQGKALALDACIACHSEDGVRAPLYQVHSHPMRVLVDFGYMPPDERLSTEEIAELKSWLDAKE